MRVVVKGFSCECVHVWRGHVIHLIYYLKDNRVNEEMYCGPAEGSAQAGQVSLRDRGGVGQLELAGAE